MSSGNWFKQDKSIVFFDLETTGADNKQDRIIEIGMLRVEPDGSESEYLSKVNPGIRIPPESTEIHHITDNDVKDAPSFKDISGRVWEMFEGADVSGYNIRRFDLKFIVNEYNRLGKQFSLRGRRIIDPMQIFQLLNPRTLGAAYKFYCGEELKNAHSAMADCRAAYDVLKGQMAKHNDLSKDPDELHELCNGVNRPGAVDPDFMFTKKFGEILFNFGKYRGEKLSDIVDNNPGYIKWIVESGGFSPEVEDLLKPLLAHAQQSKK